MEGFALRTGDLAAIVIYIVGIVVLGAACASRVRSTEGYFVGGRSMPGWAVGISMLGTAISSVTFLAYPGSAYDRDWSLLVPGLTLPFAAVVGLVLFVPFYRKAMLVSAYQYLERRFGTPGRLYACLVFTIASIWRMAIILYLVSVALEVFLAGSTGWDLSTIIIVGGIIITFYTVLGGIEAVIWTDVIQTLVLLLGGLATVAVVFWQLPGGPAQVFHDGMAGSKFHLHASLDWSFAKLTLWVLIVGGFIGNLQEFSADQTKVQRYCAPKTTRAAQLGVWVCGLGCIPVWSLFMFVGTCLFVYYRQFPDLLADGLRADQVFPYFMLHDMPTVLGGLVVAAVMAAAMSSIDSSMNGTATVLTKDIYENLYFPNRSDKHYLWAARILATLLGVGTIWGALLLTEVNQQAILEMGLIIAAITAGGLGGFVFLGFFSTRANGRGAAVGLTCALLVIVYMTISAAGYLPDSLKAGYHPFLTGALGNFFALAVGYIASLYFSAPRREDLRNLTFWTKE